MMRTITIVAATAILAAVAAPAFAQGWGPGFMHGYGPQSGTQLAGPALSVDAAIARAQLFLGTYRSADLVPVEVIEFSSVFYVAVQEKSTGKGAFALLVNRFNGNVSLEMGPPMMWNLKYGHWAGGFQGRPMGMMGGGMMGPGHGPGAQPAPGAPPAGQPAPPLDEAKARAALQAWVNQAFPGATIGKAVEYPGFFTYRLQRDGKTFALVSVHAFGGRVWYGWHYGTVVQEQVIR